MRRAYYYDSVIPPKDWLIYASLLWDKIWVGQAVNQLSESYANEMLLDNDASLLYELMTKTDILDSSIPAKDTSLLSDEEEASFDEYLINASSQLESMLDGSRPEFMPPPGKKFDPPTYDQMIQLSTLMNQCLTPSWAQNAFHELDYFFVNASEFQKCHSLNANVLLTSIEAVVPEKPESMDLSKLTEFRERTQLQRLKFRQEVDKLSDDLFACSTEAELRVKVKLCGEYIREQLNTLEVNYRAYKIDAIKKTMGITFTAPALLGALSSVLHVPFYMPAAIVSAISLSIAEILLAIEKGKAEVAKSPWGYLSNIKKL